MLFSTFIYSSINMQGIILHNILIHAFTIIVTSSNTPIFFHGNIFMCVQKGNCCIMLKCFLVLSCPFPLFKKKRKENEKEARTAKQHLK